MNEDRILQLFIQGSKHNTLSINKLKYFYQKGHKQATAYIQDKKHKGLPRIKFSKVKIKKQHTDLLDVIRQRKSCRNFSNQHCNKQDLFKLLKTGLTATHYNQTYERSLRAYPSGGALFGVDTFVAAGRVIGLKKGFYFCDLHRQELILFDKLNAKDNLEDKFIKYDNIISNAAFLVFLVANLKYLKTKYNTLLAYRIALLESGHMMQNLILSAGYWHMKSVPLLCFKHSAVYKHFKPPIKDLVPLYALGVGK